MGAAVEFVLLPAAGEGKDEGINRHPHLNPLPSRERKEFYKDLGLK